MTTVSLHEGDSRAVLATFAAAGMKVDAIVTSPPYADLRDYGGAPPDDFPEWLEPFLIGMRGVLKPTGSVMLNLGRIFRDGVEHPYHELTMLRARELGLERIDTLIWHKTNALPKAGPFLRDVHELVYWLAPHPETAYRGFEETSTPPTPGTVARALRAGLLGPKDDTGEYQTRKHAGRSGYSSEGVRPLSVFACSTGRVSGIRHTAPMAFDLAVHLVRLSCPPGGFVLDPFVGSGTTALAARACGRHCIGIDLDPESLEEATERWERGLVARRQVTGDQLALEGPA